MDQAGDVSIAPQLDLSGNNLVGQIPSFLTNLPPGTIMPVMYFQVQILRHKHKNCVIFMLMYAASILICYSILLDMVYCSGSLIDTQNSYPALNWACAGKTFL